MSHTVRERPDHHQSGRIETVRLLFYSCPNTNLKTGATALSTISFKIFAAINQNIEDTLNEAKSGKYFTS